MKLEEYEHLSSKIRQIEYYLYLEGQTKYCDEIEVYIHDLFKNYTNISIEDTLKDIYSFQNKLKEEVHRNKIYTISNPSFFY